MHRKLHERLRDLRVNAGYATQKSFLARAEKKAGLSIPYHRYSAIERGDLNPDPQEIVGICEALGVTTDMLLIGDRDVVVVGGLGHRGRKALLRIADEIRNLEQ